MVFLLFNFQGYISFFHLFWQLITSPWPTTIGVRGTYSGHLRAIWTGPMTSAAPPMNWPQPTLHWPVYVEYLGVWGPSLKTPTTRRRCKLCALAYKLHVPGSMKHVATQPAEDVGPAPAP